MLRKVLDLPLREEDLQSCAETLSLHTAHIEMVKTNCASSSINPAGAHDAIFGPLSLHQSDVIFQRQSWQRLEAASCSVAYLCSFSILH